MPAIIAPIAKITRPRIRGGFLRERLYGLLDETRKYPVTWISAPAGSGKTTLVAGFLEARKIPCLWYQVDEGDADLATFFSYLGMAAPKAAPRKRNLLPLLTPEYLQGIPTFTLRYFENLFSRLKPPAIMVLDNYQTVPVESIFHEVINNGCSAIPEGVNVFIVSRHDPPPVLARLRANEVMKMLGWDDLRLTLEETRGIVPLKTRETPSPEIIDQLHQTADGWVAGLVLILESIKRGVEPQTLQKMAPQEIIDYFGNEFFNKTDKTIQDFLLKAAFLSKITVKTTEALTGLSNAGNILSALSRNNYFTEMHYSTIPVYQFHPLYREFLVSRAQETFSREELVNLQYQAAKLLEQEGQIDEAVSLFRDAEEWDEIIPLILKHAPSMVEQGRIRPLEEWLRCLPKELTENNPWLLYWIAECRQQVYDFPTSQSFFEKAFIRFKNQKMTAGMFLAWSALANSIFLEGQDLSPLDHWIQVLEELLRDVKEFPSGEIGVQVAANMLNISAARQPCHPDLEVWADRAFSLAEECPNIQVRLYALFQVVNYRFGTGQMGKASPVINSLRHLLSSPKAFPLSLLQRKYMEVYCARHLAMHGEVVRALTEGLEIARRIGVQGTDNWFLTQAAASALNVLDFKAAGEFLEKVESFLPRLSRWNQFHYHMQKTRQALARQESRQASFHADRALKLANEVGTPLSRTFALIQRSHVLHELGKSDEAFDHLSQASEIAFRSNNKLQKFYIFWARARFAFDEGKETSGISFLRDALAIEREEGIIGTFIDHPPTMSRLCAKALEAGIELEAVQTLIKKRNLVPEKQHLHLENWPWPVKIYTLGRFELFKDNNPVQFQRKVQKKPFLLLKALIALGGKEINEEQLTDLLWPEAEGDRAYSAFTSTLYRLRQLLGEKAIEVHSGRLALNRRYCWVDAWDFEDLIDEADPTPYLMKKAVELYQGHFLGDKESEPFWAIPIRERLKDRFLLLIERLGRTLEQGGQWEEAITHYQKALKVDNLSEEFYQGLMTCYGSLGETVKAIQVYRRLKTTLSSVLGIEPSPKTETLYRNLTSPPKTHN